MKLILNDSINFSMRDLKALGLLTNANENNYGIIKITTTNLNNSVSTIGVSISYNAYSGAFLRLNYIVSGNPVKQDFELVKVIIPFNGYRMYITCPYSGNKVNKLFFYDGKFKTRNEIDYLYKHHSLHYGKQRNLYTSIQKIKKAEININQISRPYYKKYYNGQLTLKYQKAIEANSFLSRNANFGL